MVDVNHRRDTEHGVVADELARLFKPIAQFMECNAAFMHFVTARFIAIGEPVATLTVHQCAGWLAQWNEDYNRLSIEQGRLWVDDSAALDELSRKPDVNEQAYCA